MIYSIITNRIVFLLENSFEIEYTKEDLNNIYYILMGNIEFVFEKVNDNTIEYIIETYYDNNIYSFSDDFIE